MKPVSDRDVNRRSFLMMSDDESHLKSSATKRKKAPQDVSTGSEEETFQTRCVGFISLRCRISLLQDHVLHH